MTDQATEKMTALTIKVWDAGGQGEMRYLFRPHGCGLVVIRADSHEAAQRALWRVFLGDEEPSEEYFEAAMGRIGDALAVGREDLA
jgi:hypothetical protein